MRFTRTYDKLLEAKKKHPRYIDSGGGTRSGKTYSTLQLLYFMALGDRKPTLTSVVSETFPHLKRGAIRDFKAILGEDNLWSEDAWSKTESVYTLPNGSQIEFFSADQPSKVHGPARDRLFINEAVNIDWETARQLFIRTRGLIICDYNPTHAFWMHKEIAPKDNCISIQSTYNDNQFLPKEQINEIESNRKDRNWWRVYGEGLVGQLEGVVYDFEQVDSFPMIDKVCYGMDFGFSNDPTAIVKIGVDTGRRQFYVKQVCYHTGMLNSDIIKELQLECVGNTTPIYADCAEPKSIEEIKRAGFNIKPCDKDAPVRSDKLKFQLQWMQGWKMFVTKDSLDVINELRNYTWDKDKDGNLLNHPIDRYNHALDAVRYALYTGYGKRSNGTYNVR